jgi:replicative DNA helicase
MVPPHSPEAEMAVLGSMMLSHEAIYTVTQYLDTDNFFSEANRKIFDAIRHLASHRIGVDIISVSERLIATNDLEQIGGTPYLSDINRKTPTAANVEHYAMIVKERYLKRGMIQNAGIILSEAYDDTSDAFEVIDGANMRIHSLVENINRKTIKTPKQLADETYARLIEKCYNEESVLMSQYNSLNYFTGGFLGGDLIVIAGATGMGKTAFVQGLVRYWGVVKKLPLYVFSLEMSDEQLLYRQITADLKIGGNLLREGQIRGKEEEIKKFCDEYGETQIHIDDNAGQNIDAFCDKAIMMHKRYNFAAVFVDYLQLIKPSPSLKNESREGKVSDMSHKLKQLAREMRVPVFEVSQLSRDGKNRAETRPRLSDLRESGSIENDADLVLFCYRPYYYLDKNKKREREIDHVEEDAELILAKNRSFMDTTLDRIGFDRDKVAFVEIDDRHYQLPARNYYEPEEMAVEEVVAEEVKAEEVKIDEAEGDDVPF